MRGLVFITIFLLQTMFVGGIFNGCVSSDSDANLSAGGEGEPSQDPGDRSGDDDDSGHCQSNSDCELSASSCCECPSFAQPIADGFEQSCDEVDCEEGGLCSAVEAVCKSGECLMICSPIVVTQECPFGFEADENGCLIDFCVPKPPGFTGECMAAEDCMKIPADCCGCGRGGADQAVPVSQADEIIDSFDCSSSTLCPEIDVCEASHEALCIANLCVLGGLLDDSGGGDSQWSDCGGPGNSHCGQGMECILNAISSEESQGKGICQTI